VLSYATDKQKNILHQNNHTQWKNIYTSLRVDDPSRSLQDDAIATSMDIVFLCLQLRPRAWRAPTKDEKINVLTKEGGEE